MVPPPHPSNRHQSTSRISPTSASSTRERATSASISAATYGSGAVVVVVVPNVALGEDLGVARLGRQKLRVGALGDDPTAFDHRDAVGEADRRQAVSDDERRAVGHELAERLVDLLLDLHVDGRRRVVEHEDRRVHHEGAGDGEALALPAREREAPLPHHGVVALGELLHELVGPGGARRGLDLLERGVRAPVREVVADRHREEERLVEHHPDVVAEARQRHVAHVVVVDTHRAAGDVVEARQQAGRGRLPAAGSAHQRDGLARTHVEVEPVEHRRAVRVVERHVVEVHVAAALDEVDRAGTIDDVGLLVEHLVDALGRRRRPLAHHQDHAELAERRLQHQHVGVEGDDVAHRCPPVDDEVAAVEEHDGLAEAGQVLEQG